MNDATALSRILSRDRAEGMFPQLPARSGNEDGASRIVQELRAERLRRANPAEGSSLSRGLFSGRDR